MIFKADAICNQPVSLPIYKLQFFIIGKVSKIDKSSKRTHLSFNFELIKGGNPIFVDTGISTYEKNKRRKSDIKTT
mgnify:CR=1 FL=1